MKSLFYFSPHISVSKADMLHAMPHIEEILANVDELEQVADIATEATQYLSKLMNDLNQIITKPVQELYQN